MLITNEYTKVQEQCSKEPNNVKSNNPQNSTVYCPEFVTIKCEIKVEDLSRSVKEEPLSDDEGSYTKNLDSKHLFLADEKPNISLLEYSNFTSAICKKDTSVSAYNSDDTKTELTVTEKTQKYSSNENYNQGCLQCQRKNALENMQLKNQDNPKCNWPVFSTFPCSMCNRLSKEAVSVRLKDLSIEKRFFCDICNKRFQCRSTIIRHMQVHNANKQYSCKICNKKFSCAGLIKPHMRSHTGEKPYTCLICKKRFSHKCNMQRHMERHKKVKNTKCQVCSKTFPMESRLKYHMRTHTNEKPFQCGICKKVFSHKQNIQRHYSAKHPCDKFKGTETDASVARIVWDKIVNKVVELLPN